MGFGKKLHLASSSSKDDQQALFYFLLKHGHFDLLIEYTLDIFLQPEFEIPWPYFFEALHKAGIVLNHDSVLQIKKFLKSESSQMEAARSTCFDEFIPEMSDWRGLIARYYQQRIETERTNDLDHLLMLRTQQLVEKEKEFLNLLQRKYPTDTRVKEELRKFQERYAEEIILKHKPRKTAPTPLPLEPERINHWRSWSLQWLTVRPAMAEEIMLCLIMIDLEELALEIWQRVGSPSSWLGAQILFLNERFIEVLALLPQIEQAAASNPDTFFATSFLRAQSFWGLGQKTKAIEILEALLVSQPDYRFAQELLQSGGAKVEKELVPLDPLSCARAFLVLGFPNRIRRATPRGLGKK